jgi:hypothetical protein
LPTVTKALAVGDTTSAQTFGIVQSDITNMNNGFVVVAGGIDNLDTQAYSVGTALYLSPTTAGAWTSTKPYAPQHLVYLGVVVRSHPTQGVIEVKIQNGYELDELHNVSARFPSNKDGLFYNTANSVWENKSIEGVLGYTPVPNSRVITINGTAQDLSADRTYNVGTVTSVNATVPTGFEVSGVPITNTGTIDIKFASGYSLPTTAKQTEWDTAYTKRIDSLTVTGNSGSASLVSNILNIPTYTLNGLGGEPAIAAGTTLQYFRGDKTFQTLDTSVVPENGPVYFTEPRVRQTVLSGLNVTGGSIVATDNVLNAFGKIQNQINGLIGGSIFQSTWNASTNVPTLTSSVGTKGYYYIVSTAGNTNLDGITDWQIGDWAIFDGTVWRKVDNTDAVVSVNGFTGIVNLALDNISDVSATSPTGGQLLRFNGTSSVWENWTPTYISAAITSLNGLTGAVQTMVTGTAGTDFTIDASGTVHTFNIPTASATNRGLLSSADWTTFNNKQNALTNPVTGTGTLNYIPKFTATGSTIGNSQIFDNGTNIGIGTALPLVKLHMELSASTYTNPGDNNVPSIYLYNTKNDNASAHAIVAMRTTGANGGNPFVSWDIGGIIGWSAGIDNADDDSFKISRNWLDLTSNTRLRITQSGTVRFNAYTTDGILKVSNSDGTIAVAVAGDFPILNQNTTGSAATLTTARNFTINGTAKSFDGSANVSWTASEIGLTSYLPLTGGTLTNTGSNGTAILNFVGSSTDNFQWMTWASNSSLAAGKTLLYTIGKNNTTKNAGYIGYQWNSDGGDDNFMTIGLFSADHLLKVFGNGNATLSGAFTSSISALGSAASTFVVSDSGTLKSRTAAQVLSDIGAASSSSLANYLPLAGGALTGRVTMEFSASTYSTPATTNIPSIYIYNTNTTTATAHANLTVRSGGPNGGDAFISFDIATVLGYSLGIDNSDSDKFKLSQNWANIGSTDLLVIDTSGNTTITGDLSAKNITASGGGDLILTAATSGSNTTLYNDTGTMVVTTPISVTGTGTFSGNVTISKSSNSGSGSVFPRFQVENTLATQGDGSSTFNFADIRIASGNSAVQMFLATTYAAGTWAPAGIINVSTNHDLQIKTNNTTRLTIANSGAATFSSFITAASTGGSGLRVYGGSGTNQWDIYLNSTNLRFSDNTGTGSVVFDRPATFSSSVTASGVRSINSGVDGTFVDTFVGVYSVTNAEQNAIQCSVSGAASLSGFRFQASNGNLSANRTTVLDLLRGGAYFYTNVGIGTYPSYKLHISGGKTIISSTDSAYGQFQIGNTSSATTSEAAMCFISGATAFGSPSSANGNNYIWVAGAGIFGMTGNIWGIGNVGFNNPIITLKSDGNIAIGRGTTGGDVLIDARKSASTYNNPQDNNLPTLSLYNTNNSSTNAHAITVMRTGGASGGNPFISFDIAGVTGFSMGMDNSDGDKFKIANSWSSLGSNTRFTMETGGAATFSSSVTATSFFESSDIRLKTNIRDLNVDVSKISAKIYEKDGKIEIGYIAQDVNDILKSAVSIRENGFLDLSYRQIHTAKIAQLEKEIAELKLKLK